MRIALVRGAYLNNFEMQNYHFKNKDIALTAISSKRSIHSEFPFPVIKLPSVSDLPIPHQVTNRTLGDSQLLFGLGKVVASFDIVHTADPHYYYSYQLAKQRKEHRIKRLIATSWETIPFNNESVAQKKRIKQFTMKYIDHYLCYCMQAKESLLKEGVSPSKITVIHLGVKLRTFFPSKKALSSQKLKVLFTGRNVPEKGYDDLERAVAQTMRMVTARHVPYEKMPEQYRHADIFVMPSKTSKTWEEQYGMSLIEALASGLPIIAYRSGSLPELLGDAGILVKEGDVRELAKQLHRLSKDANLRQKLGTMARRRAQLYFDSANTARRLQSFYETQYRHIDS